MIATAPASTLPIADSYKEAILGETGKFFRRSRPKVIRPILQFCEEEIRIVEGKYEDRKFKASRQPFSRLVLEEFNNRHWNRYIGLGCVQSGKTLLFVVFPAAYLLLS